MSIVRYVGGPLDGQELDVSGWSDESVRGGVYEVVDGWVDRADYSPDEDGDGNPLVRCRVYPAGSDLVAGEAYPAAGR